MQVNKIFIWEKNETKTGEFRYSMTITNSPLVVQTPPQNLRPNSDHIYLLQFCSIYLSFLYLFLYFSVHLILHSCKSKKVHNDGTQKQDFVLQSTFVLSSSSPSRSSTGRCAIERQPGTGSISSNAPRARANFRYCRT